MGFGRTMGTETKNSMTKQVETYVLGIDVS